MDKAAAHNSKQSIHFNLPSVIHTSVPCRIYLTINLVISLSIVFRNSWYMVLSHFAALRFRIPCSHRCGKNLHPSSTASAFMYKFMARPLNMFLEYVSYFSQSDSDAFLLTQSPFMACLNQFLKVSRTVSLTRHRIRVLRNRQQRLILRRLGSVVHCYRTNKAITLVAI